jgi:TonB family protein
MVRVRVQVGPDGRPLQAKVVDSTNPLFNSAVIEAALSSQFEPARSASGPVTAWVTVPISFGK